MNWNFLDPPLLGTDMVYRGKGEAGRGENEKRVDSVRKRRREGWREEEDLGRRKGVEKEGWMGEGAKGGGRSNGEEGGTGGEEEGEEEGRGYINTSTPYVYLATSPRCSNLSHSGNAFLTQSIVGLTHTGIVLLMTSVQCSNTKSEILITKLTAQLFNKSTVCLVN